jgi:hypothetical protein
VLGIAHVLVLLRKMGKDMHPRGIKLNEKRFVIASLAVSMKSNAAISGWYRLVRLVMSLWCQQQTIKGCTVMKSEKASLDELLLLPKGDHCGLQ